MADLAGAVVTDITSATMDALQETRDTCPACGCTERWRDLSAPSPIEDWCGEPEKWRIDGVACYCHSQSFIEGWLQ